MKYSVYSAPWLAAPHVPDSPYLFLPTESSTSAVHVDALYSALFWASTLTILAVILTMGYLVYRYQVRGRSVGPAVSTGQSNRRVVEVTASVVPLVLVIGLFTYGFKGYVDLRTAPKDAMDIQVTGQNWKWSFGYSNGLAEDVLHVPVDSPVRLILSSTDAVHSLSVPAFRVKMDAVPGRYTELWFRATQVGEFPVLCGEYCGTGGAEKATTVVVHEPGGFEKWLEGREKELMDKPPAELGKALYAQQSCSTCHSIDGSPLVGPSFKGLFGRDEVLADGSSVKVDESYIRESILDPQSKIVKGFSPSMPTNFKGKLKDQDLTGLIEFIKTLK